MLRDIYEWLLEEKKMDSRTIQSVRDYERKHKCTAYTAIEKMEICSIGEIREGVLAVFNVRSLNCDVTDLQTSPYIPIDDMRRCGFIAMYDPSRSTTNQDDLVTLILIYDPRNKVPAMDAVSVVALVVKLQFVGLQRNNMSTGRS